MNHNDGLIWEPLKRVGAIEFGKPLGSAASAYELTRRPAEEGDKTGWLTYGNPTDTIRVYTEHGRVTAVSCHENCMFNGTNLIGMTIGAALALLRCRLIKPDDDVIEMPDGRQRTYSLDTLEAMLWVKRARVVSVSLG